jgi:RNA polymerase sigma-70 factor, ECF subfamily
MNTEIVWSEFSDSLLFFIKSKVKDNIVAQDILQDSFIKIHTKISSLKDQSKLKSWLYQIVRNTINDYYKKKKLVLIEKYPEIEENLSPKENECLDKCLRPFISQISPKYSDAILKTELGNLSQKEYASLYNIPYSTAKSRVQRGKSQLKELFVDSCLISYDSSGNMLLDDGCEDCKC